MQKFETLALKKLYQQLEMGYFRILVFRLKLIISSTSAYFFFLMLYSGNKKLSIDEKTDPVFKGKAVNITFFTVFREILNKFNNRK